MCSTIVSASLGDDLTGTNKDEGFTNTLARHRFCNSQRLKDGLFRATFHRAKNLSLSLAGYCCPLLSDDSLRSSRQIKLCRLRIFAMKLLAHSQQLLFKPQPPAQVSRSHTTFQANYSYPPKWTCLAPIPTLISQTLLHLTIPSTMTCHTATATTFEFDYSADS